MLARFPRYATPAKLDWTQGGLTNFEVQQKAAQLAANAAQDAAKAAEQADMLNYMLYEETYHNTNANERLSGTFWGIRNIDMSYKQTKPRLDQRAAQKRTHPDDGFSEENPSSVKKGSILKPKLTDVAPATTKVTWAERDSEHLFECEDGSKMHKTSEARKHTRKRVSQRDVSTRWPQKLFDLFFGGE
jgi:hypothetical protein